RDGGNGLFALNKISATPTYYVVDPDGVIKEIFMGVDLVKIIGIMKEHGGFAEPSYTTENGATVVNNPKFEDINSTFLIDRIEIYKDSTVAHCTNPMPGAYMIATNTGFFANGKCISKITKCDIGFDQYVPVPFGKVGHCRLVFEPLPKDIKTFDFIEGDCENCFRVMGVKIEN
ncbi:MAG: hypothetical protein IJ150_09190, partial [Bacteroidales bacterium]|nr:hypothetical protein [Bacteroidales bacterium]